MTLEASAYGRDARALVDALASTPPFSQRSPIRVRVDHKIDIAPDGDWLAEAMTRTSKSKLSATWARADGERYGGPFLGLDPSGTVVWVIEEDRDAESIIGLAQQLAVDVMVLGPRYRWSADRRPLVTFSDGHRYHGWAVVFKGDGHERLVSRRWLEHGPWLVRQSPGDVSYVQFHDLSADSVVAWEQANRAHVRIGIDDAGGYLHPDHQSRTRISGVYSRTARSLTISRGNGQPMTQREMLDLCAHRRRSLVEDEPIERIRILFLAERDARRHLHELWLRELECWFVDGDGREVRADDAYQPERIVPEWVERSEGIAPVKRVPVARLSLGLASLLANPEGELPGGWSRDDLLFHITDHHNPGPAYSVREVMGAHIPRVSASANEEGELVITAAQGVGGTMPSGEAAALLAKVRQAPTQADIWVTPERLGLTLPAIIVPDPYLDQRPMRMGDDHPLRGVVVHAVGDVMARVRSLNREDVRETEELLRLCAEDRFVLSVVAA